MEAVHRSPALPGQLVSAVGQEAQDGGRVLEFDPAQLGLTLRHPGHAGRIDAIGLAPMTPGQHAGTCGEGRRNIEHDLAPRDEPLGEEPAEARGALHGPRPVGPALRPAEQPLDRRLGRGQPDLGEDAAALVERDRSV